MTSPAPAANPDRATNISWLVGLAVVVPLYYVLASRKVRSEIVPAVDAAVR